MAPKSTPQAKDASANPMWGGHYRMGPEEAFASINPSIDVDRHMYAQDIAASIAHANMLARQGIIATADAASIVEGLKTILGEIERGEFEFRTELEDIHMNIEARLKERIGEAAGRLHTGRSRNDQVATDFRLWVRDAIDRIDAELKGLQQALLLQAEKHIDTILPGFTHLQAAQPISFGHHLLAYVEMIGRDRTRLHDARKRLNECPLGAAALAGTPYPIDRDETAKALGFTQPMANSLDAVSSRDFAMEFLAALSIHMVHLSRLAEELILWMSPGYRFVQLPEGFTSGSSIMPQKRNPDAAELVRGKSGTVIGALQSLLVMMKSLPLAYNKDMQEDKKPVFDAASQALLCIAAMQGMVAGMVANTETMRSMAQTGYATATDLADWLVRELGMPFRDAHHVTGRVVRLAEEHGKRLDELSLADMQAIEPRITADIFAVLSVEASVTSRQSFGGTSPLQVREAIDAAKRRFGL